MNKLNLSLHQNNFNDKFILVNNLIIYGYLRRIKI